MIGISNVKKKVLLLEPCVASTISRLMTQRLPSAWCAGGQLATFRGERMSSSSSASSSYESSSEEDEEEQEVEELTLEPIKEGTFVSANLKKGLGRGRED